MSLVSIFSFLLWSLDNEFALEIVVTMSSGKYVHHPKGKSKQQGDPTHYRFPICPFPEDKYRKGTGPSLDQALTWLVL